MNKQTITVNKLPVPTWNRLKMNETVLSIDEEMSGGAELTVTPAGCAAVTNDTTLWDSIGTGMGGEIENMLKAASAHVFTSESGSTRIFTVRVSCGKDGGSAKLYLHAKENSRLDLTLMCTGDTDTVEKRTLAVEIKILAERGSKVRLYSAQILPKGVDCLCGIGAMCEESASFELVKPEIGKADIYTGVLTELKGAHSSFDADMCYVGSGSQRLDFNYVVRHEGRHTTSNMNVVGSLKDDAFKLFRGSIDFVSGCAGAKGDEREEVLLLDGDPVNQTIPLILCSEEDVEGNHGASIGELDDRTLFYMATRGISADEAERIIAKARVDSVSSKIPDEDVRREIDEYMGGEELSL